jgi:hypothetical protein
MQRIGKMLMVTLGLIFAVNSAQAERLGGISGGGGNVKAAEPIDLAYVRNMLPLVRPAVLGALNNIEYQKFNVNAMNFTPSQAWYDVFKWAPTIFEVMESAKIELKVEGPCLDADGNPVDGSIYGVGAGNICISAESLIAKSNSALFFQDAGALIAHEFAHLAGADEEMAMTVQQYAFENLSRSDFWNLQFLSSIFVGALKDGMETYQDNMGRINDFANSCVRSKYMNVLIFWAQQYIWFPGSGGIVLRGEEFAKFGAKTLKSNIISEYLCSQDSAESRSTNLASQREIDIGFASDTSVDLKDYASRVNVVLREEGIMVGYDYPAEAEIMQRPTSLDDALIGLQDVHRYLANSYNHLEHIMERNFDIIEN